MSTSLPIACTLSSADLADRTAEIAALNGSSLRSHRRKGLELELVYERDAAERVRELVRREQSCCAFLRFAIAESSNAITLRIEAPAEAREGVDALFAPFLEGSSRADDRGSRIAGVAAATSATAAIACGVCCVLPFALPAVAATALGGVFAVFAGAYRWAVDLATIAVAAGWLWVAWQSVRTGRRAAPSTLRAMLVATVIFGAALSWPLLEPHAIALFKP